MVRGRLFWLLPLFGWVLTPLKGSAQHQFGVVNSNNAGILSVHTNPANAADSRFWFDANVFSVDFNVNQNVVRTRFGLRGILRDDSGFTSGVGTLFNPRFFDGRRLYPKQRDLFFSRTNFDRTIQGAYASLNMMLPSVMFAVGKNLGVAISTRSRALLDFIDRIDGSDIIEKYDRFLDQPIRNSDNRRFGLGNFKSAFHRFAEFTLTLATPVFDKGRHYLKSGLTIKRLIGYDYGTFRSLHGGFTVDVTPDPETIFDNPKVDGTLTFYGIADASSYKNPAGNLSPGNIGDNINYFFNGVFGRNGIPGGWGVDLGFVYEFRPFYQYQNLHNAAYNTTDKYIRDIQDYTRNKYVFRWSIALRDFGFVTYDGANTNGFHFDTKGLTEVSPISLTTNYVLRGDVPKIMDEIFDQVDKQASNQLRTALHRTLKMYLPAHLITQFDVLLWRDRVFVNAAFIANLVAKHTFATRTPTMLAVSPRYETDKFDVSVPLSYNFFYNQLKIGIGVNFQQIFFMGLDDAAILLGGFSGANVYFGVRMAMRKRKPFVRVFDFEKTYHLRTGSGPVQEEVRHPADPIPSGQYQAPRSSNANPFREFFKRSLKQQNPVQPFHIPPPGKRRTGRDVQSLQRTGRRNIKKPPL